MAVKRSLNRTYQGNLAEKRPHGSEHSLLGQVQRHTWRQARRDPHAADVIGGLRICLQRKP
jgi:hypothetical protein